MTASKKTGPLRCFLRRTALLAVTAVLLLLFAAYTFLGTVFRGPSPIARDELTVALMADSATDWIPGLFLDEELIRRICG